MGVETTGSIARVLLRGRSFSLALILLALVLLAAPGLALGAFPGSPSPEHRCEGVAQEPPFGFPDRRNPDAAGDCYALAFARNAVEEILSGVRDADTAARLFEQRAEKRGTKSAWIQAVRARAAARTEAGRAVVFTGATGSFLPRIAKTWTWQFPEFRRLATNLISAARASLVGRKRLMDLQLAANLRRVRRPRSLPAFTAQRRRISALDGRRRTADAAAKRFTGTKRSTLTGDPDPAGLWAEYQRRLALVSRMISGDLQFFPAKRSALFRPQRRPRVALIRDLIQLLREETVQVLSRARAARAGGGACSAGLVQHAANERRRAGVLSRWVRAVEQGRFAAANRRLRENRNLANRGKRLAKRVGSCLAAVAQPPPDPSAPFPPEGRPGPGRATGASCLEPMRIDTASFPPPNTTDYTVSGPVETVGDFAIWCRYRRADDPSAGVEMILKIYWDPDKTGACDEPRGEPFSPKGDPNWRSTRREINVLLEGPAQARLDGPPDYLKNVVKAAEAEGAGRACE